MTATRVEITTLPYEAAFARGLREIPLYPDEKASLTKSFKAVSDCDFDATFIRSVAESLYEQAEQISESAAGISIDAIIRYDEEIQKATFSDHPHAAAAGHAVGDAVGHIAAKLPHKKAKAAPPAEPKPEPAAPPVTPATGAVEVDKIAMFSHPDPPAPAPVTAPTIIMTPPATPPAEPAYVPVPSDATDDDDTVPAHQGSETLIVVVFAIVGLILGAFTIPLIRAGFTGTDSTAYFVVGLILCGLWLVAWLVAGIYIPRLVIANHAKKRAASAARS